MNVNKLGLFLKNARILDGEFGIVPLLYGSLGLEYLTRRSLGSDDIDILIPRMYVTEKWHYFKEIMEKKGYILTDENEHTFVLNGVAYSYAEIEELERFVGIRADDIDVYTEDGTKFLLLSPEQYLAVYQRSSKDGYRISVRKKKDSEKIELLKELIADNKEIRFCSQRLYELLTTVPKGRVITYGQLAEMLGNKGWARAVGNALHKNPDGNKYPCYRVVNSKGELSASFVFGGEDVQKKRLEADGIEVVNGKVDLNKYGINNKN